MTPEKTNSLQPIFDYSHWLPEAKRLQSAYNTDRPFPNIIMDNFLNPVAAHKASEEYALVDWQSYRHYNENKQGGNPKTLPTGITSVLAELNSPRFLEFLSNLTGIENLIPDPTLGSGGIHQSERGGFLNIHADFTVHPYHHDWRRRLNVLVYLNEEWPESWGGELEIWSRDMKKCERKITPIFNRCFVFNTDETSFHGHPEPMTCPEGVKRKSIALYYYTLDNNVTAISTEYRPRPEDGSIKSVFIFVDKMALRFFHWAKATFKLPDSLITNIMDLFRGGHGK